jgi:hypothetical protein
MAFLSARVVVIREAGEYLEEDPAADLHSGRDFYCFPAMYGYHAGASSKKRASSISGF